MMDGRDADRMSAAIEALTAKVALLTTAVEGVAAHLCREQSGDAEVEDCDGDHGPATLTLAEVQLPYDVGSWAERERERTR